MSALNIKLDPRESADRDARNARPDLFALADDLLEAEMIRTGQLTDAAEALLVNGWMMGAAA